MSFYSGPVPQVHQTKNFTFRPLKPKYTDLDFDALMATRTVLRQWSNSPWPQDDFSLEANRADLQRHYDEFQNDEAYAYTVLNPEENRVEGCLYINSLKQFLEKLDATEETIRQVGSDEANLGFWIRGDRLGDEGILLRDIIHWLDTQWEFSHMNYGIFDANTRQETLYKAEGMNPRFQVAHTNGASLLFYHKG